MLTSASGKQIKSDNPIMVYRHSLADLCKRHRVKYLYVFGSANTRDYRPGESDIDLLVELKEMPAEERGQLLLDLWDSLEATLHVKVDLLTASSIKNPYLRKSINETKALIYDGSREEILI